MDSSPWSRVTMGPWTTLPGACACAREPTGGGTCRVAGAQRRRISLLHRHVCMHVRGEQATGASSEVPRPVAADVPRQVQPHMAPSSAVGAGAGALLRAIPPASNLHFASFLVLARFHVGVLLAERASLLGCLSPHINDLRFLPRFGIEQWRRWPGRPMPSSPARPTPARLVCDVALRCAPEGTLYQG